jgi:hypothetical protein
MKSKRRIFIAVAAIFPIAAHAACSATNGDPIPSQVFDASALDVSNPDDPEPGAEAGSDGSTKKDASTDAPVDAKDAAPGNAPVQINELFVDNDGLGDGAEFVELRAAPGTPADDLKLRLVHANGQVKYEVTVGPAGATFNGNGIWVVGGMQTFKLNAKPDHVDQVVALSKWGLDNDRGAIQVVRGTTLLDVVGYARDPDAGALPPLALPPTATVEGTVATVPDAPTTTPAVSRIHRSFGRKNGAADTNQNATDFCAMEASPGFVQKNCL